MKRKFLALFLVCTLLLSAFAALTAVAESGSETVATDGSKAYTLSELIAKLGDETFNTADLTLTLTSDITVTEWTSVATFKGTLDGNGHKISGLNAPLFAKLDGATVKNLTVEGVLLCNDLGTSTVNASLLANTTSVNGSVTVTNVTVNGSITIYSEGTSGKIYSGAFFSTVNSPLTMTNCISNVVITGAKNAEKEVAAKDFYVGGLVGLSVSDVTATGCVNNGALYLNTSKTNLVAGILGQHSTAGTNRKVSFEKCANNGDITLPSASNGCKAGGMMSVANVWNVAYSFVNCVNTGSISAVSMAAGICADDRGGLTVDHCYNFGAVTASAASGNSFAAGIIGQIYVSGSNLPALPTVKNCVNLAAVNASGASTSGFASGIVGVATLNFEAFENNYNQGNIACTANYAAGLIAKLQPADGDCKTVLKGCITYSKVEGKNPANFIGLLNKAGTLTMTDSYAWNNCKTAIKTNKASTVLVYNGETKTATELNTAHRSSKANLVKCTAIHGLGVQCTAINATTGTLDVRFLAGLNVLEGYGRVGFELIRMEANGAPSATVSKNSNVVYTSVTGYDKDGNEIVYQASDLTVSESDKPWNYLSAITVKGVPATGTVTFMVRPYLLSTDGTVTSYGMPFCMTFVDGAVSAS